MSCDNDQRGMTTKLPRKESPSWWPCLLGGVCLASICLSLVCLAHLLFVQRHSCECLNPAATNSDDEKPATRTNIKPINQSKQQDEVTRGRQRRNIQITAGQNMFYQIQTQIMMIETRLRLMQNQMKRRQSVVGRRGPTGPAGRPGRNGLDGRSGMDGPTGMPGRDGKNGKDGPPGPPGASGPPGVNGLQGQRGELGMKGSQGILGQTGERGLPGPKGSRGPSGRSGENGEPGHSGQTGPKGAKGKPGAAECYVTREGKRVVMPCYLAAQEPVDSNSQNNAAGVIFYRWGRTTCPIGSRSVYSGQAGSVAHDKHRPGGSNYQCIPRRPWYFGQRDPRVFLMRNASRPRNVEGETTLESSLYYLSCVACLTKKRSIQIMLPARKECYRSWHREYDGFLAVQVNRGDNKELICVDREARGIFGTPDYVMALRADCNTFDCPPFTDRERLPCVVCTM